MSVETIGSICSTAPSRFDFGGAPTDVEPYRSREGGHIVNGTINIKAHATIVPRIDGRIFVYSDNFENNKETYDSIRDLTVEGPLRLLKAAIMHVAPSQGFELATNVEAPPGSGLGSSASLAVAVLSALRTFMGEVELDPMKLVEDALHVENVMLGNVNGGQDQYATALGGFHGMEFLPDQVAVKRINIANETIAELEARSLLCHSGDTHVSGQVLENVMTAYVNGEQATVDGLRTLKELSYEIEEALSNGDVDHFGRIMKATGEAQKKCHPSMIPPGVDRLFKIARQHGAIGGKIAGAGGAGFVYFFCRTGCRDAVAESLKNNGNLVVPVKFTTDGVVVTSL